MSLVYKIAAIFSVALILGCSSGLHFSKAHSPYQPPVPTIKKPKLALVLGGGGSKGLAHLGVLEVLNQEGIKPDLIVGCSAGAIVGGMYVSDPNIEHLKTKLLTSKKADILVMSPSVWPFGLYDGFQMQRYLKANIAQHNFAAAKIPFVVVATNLQFGTVTVFGVGDMIKPIMASAAYPGGLPPVLIAGQYYVDGGVTEPVPVQTAKDFGAQKIIAVNIASKLPASAPVHLLGVVKRSLDIAYLHQSKITASGADVIIDFDFKDIDPFSDEFNYALYQAGKAAASKALPEIRRILAE